MLATLLNYSLPPLFFLATQEETRFLTNQIRHQKDALPHEIPPARQAIQLNNSQFTENAS